MKNKFEVKASLKPHRRFSIQIRKQTVQDIERGKCSVLQASRELQSSPQTIYNWIYLYSRYLQKNQILVVEHKSEARIHLPSFRLRRRLRQVKASKKIRASISTEALCINW